MPPPTCSTCTLHTYMYLLPFHPSFHPPSLSLPPSSSSFSSPLHTILELASSHHPIHSKPADSRASVSVYSSILPHLILRHIYGSRVLIYLLPCPLSPSSSLFTLPLPPLPSNLSSPIYYTASTELYYQIHYLGRPQPARLSRHNEVLLHCCCCHCHPRSWLASSFNEIFPSLQPETPAAGPRRRLATPRTSDEPARGEPQETEGEVPPHLR